MLQLRSELLPSIALCIAFASGSTWADSESHRRAGDVLRLAMPVGVLGYEAWRHDSEGLRQFGASWALTIGATEVLKNSTHVERPDRSGDGSFPSGHASNAFAAATYMHWRHGFGAAWPWYAAATYVGWTRVQAHRHRWTDVAGSAALAGLSSQMVVTTANDNKTIAIAPMLSPRAVALDLHMRW
jgi:membrane-associated phospholipid phosphatase